MKVVLFFVYFNQFDEMGVIEGFNEFVFGAVLGNLLLGQVLFHELEVGVLGLAVKGEGVDAIVAMDYLHT